MHKVLVWFAAAALVAAALLGARSASAVVGGTDDTTGQFPSVGVLQLQDGGEWFDYCSGTLVASNVVLTAAHCVDFLGPGDVRVTFDAAPDAGSTYYHADHFSIPAAWLAAGPCFGNSKHACLSPGHEDIALIWLDTDVSGVTPSEIADRGYLDRLRLTRQTFTVVGYGVDDFITGSLLANHPVVVVDGVRSYRNVTAITKQDAFPDRFLKVTKSVCFGDSGGPVFHRGVIVALNTWTFSTRCDGPNLEYRVDSAPAQAFLDANL
jgi:trypsin